MSETAFGLVQTWAAWIVPMTIQASLFLAVLAAVDRLWRRRIPPAVWTVAWLVALAKLVVPPSLASPLALFRGVGMDSGLATPPALATTPVTADVILAAGCAIWIVGGLVFATRASRATVSWRRKIVASAVDGPELRRVEAALVHAAKRVRLRRVPRVVVTPLLQSPAVTGWLSPLLAVPTEIARNADDVVLSAMVLHEVTHLRRGDPLVAGAARVLHGVYWFIPFVGLARRRLAALAEFGCDAAVARLLAAEATTYRDALLDHASALASRGVGTLPPPRSALAFMNSSGDEVVARIRALDGLTPRRRRLQSGVAVVVAVLLAACVAPMGERRTGEAVAQDDAARDTIERWEAGQSVSCFRVRWAAMRLYGNPGVEDRSSKKP